MLEVYFRLLLSWAVSHLCENVITKENTFLTQQLHLVKLNDLTSGWLMVSSNEMPVCSDTEYCDVFTAPDGPPQDVTLEPTSPQSIKVSWKVKSKLYVLKYELRHWHR